MPGIGRAAGLLLFLALTDGAGAASRDADLRRIEDSLAHAGPQATLKTYFDCDKGIGWKLVSSGDPRAVKIAFGVMPAADACYSEILSIVLGEALSSNPKLMLGYYAKYPVQFSDWCIPGLIDPTDAEWSAAIDKAERAVLSVRDPALVKPRQICLDAIARARQQPLR